MHYTLNGKIDRKAVPEINEIEAVSVEVDYFQNEIGVKKEIYQLFTEITGVTISRENYDSILAMINSLDFIKLLVKLEEKYQIEIDVEYLSVEAYKSLDDVCCYIEKLSQRKEDA